MPELADNVKQAQTAFGTAEPQPVAGNPCPPPMVAAQSAPAPTPATQPVFASASTPPEKSEKKEEKAKTWVEIVLVDMEGKPVPGVRYRVNLPGGQVKEGTLNAYGQAGFYELDPGSCKVTFPDLDEAAWERS